MWYVIDRTGDTSRLPLKISRRLGWRLKVSKVNCCHGTVNQRRAIIIQTWGVSYTFDGHTGQHVVVNSGWKFKYYFDATLTSFWITFGRLLSLGCRHPCSPIWRPLALLDLELDGRPPVLSRRRNPCSSLSLTGGFVGHPTNRWR